MWLRLISFLLLCVVVYGKEVECDEVSYGDFCWNSTGVNFIRKCWSCQINEQQLATNESLVVSGKLENVNIEHVTISSKCSKMPKVLQKFTNKQIVEVGLYKTYPTVLNSHFFVNSCENLKVFFVTYVDGTSVENFTFRNCSSLEYLDLSINSLQFIPFYAFIGLNKLITLDLSWNKLKYLHSKLFQDLGNLEQLDLHANKLEEISDKAFNKLNKLKKLDLNYNKITTIKRKMLQNNKQLNSINLEKNKIKIIQLDTFKYLNKLTKLNLKENNCIKIIFDNKTSAEIAEALNLCYPTNCIIPTIQNGDVISSDENSKQTPGDSYDHFYPLKVVCNSTFFLFTVQANISANICQLEGYTNQEWPECHS